MTIGDKIIITKDGDTKKYLQAKGVVENIHPVNRAFWEECYTFVKGMVGIIEDVNALGDKWKIRVGKELYYVPVEFVTKK